MMLLLAVWLLYAGNAAAIQPANVTDVQEIENHIARAHAAEDAIRKNNLDRKAPNADIQRLDSELSRHKNNRKTAYDQALWLTIRAYGIIPFHDDQVILHSGTSVLRSPEKGTLITWLPIFEEYGLKPVQDERGNRAGSRNMSDRKFAGNTASDGVSRIFPGAFDSPQLLASILNHEYRHFKQNTTSGEGDAKSTAELEVAAYEEEERLIDLFGFFGDARKDQMTRLARELAPRRRRAAADRIALNKTRGLPPPEGSIVSHSEPDFRTLVQQAREQVKIAQKDHDERLSRTLLELMERSCANQGIVAQTELDALPKPHHANFMDAHAIPVGGRKCDAVYFYLGKGGRDAAEVRRLSPPEQPPLIVRPQPQPIPIRPVVPVLFSSVFPQLKEFAEAACRDSAQAPIPRFGSYVFLYREYDDRLAIDLSAGMTDCSRQLFNQMINTIRGGQSWGIDRQWVQQMVAAFSLTPDTGGTPANPPQRGGCEVGGDPFGCQPRRPR